MTDEMDTLAERVVDWHRENATGINGLSFSEIDLAHLYTYTVATLHALAQMDIPIAPPGSVVVPREPTEEMMWAGEDARKNVRRTMGSVGGQTLENSMLMHHAIENAIYRAMIAAAGGNDG